MCGFVLILSTACFGTALRYKDTCKSALKSGGILDEWQQVVYDRALWRATAENVWKRMNENRVKKYVQRKEQSLEESSIKR